MRSSPMRLVARVAPPSGAALLAACVLFATTSARAQDEGDAESGGSVTTSALMLLEGGATEAQGATVAIGLRRGLGEVTGVRFVHPVDVLSPAPYSDDVQMSIDELEPLADQVRDGDARDAAARSASIAEMFEANLEAVRREQLVDAYVLDALAQCRLRRMSQCESGLERVLVFREAFQYDAERYPPQYQEVFERVRSRTLSGARATLEVVTEPAGAEVYVDGRSYGPSPARAEGLLVGDHYVTIKHLGYMRTIRRATLGRAGSGVSYTLEPNERSRLVASEEFQRALRGELGEERAGPNVRSLGNTLGAAQVIVGVVRPLGDAQVHVMVWLYDVRTRFLLAQREGTLTTDEAGMAAARELAIALYGGVDLAGTIAAPEEEEQIVVTREPELWEQWWFWTAIGVVAASGVAIGIGVAATPPGVPEGFTRFESNLP